MIRTLPTALFMALQIMSPGLNLSAQTKPAERQDNLQQQKIKFFTENLQLTQTESTHFWPVYNDYQNRRDKVTRDRNTMMLYFEANKNNMTEKEADELIIRYLAFQQEETRLLEFYTKKFGEFLPAKKVMRIYIVELDFKKWLLENLRQNKVQATPRN